MSENIRKKQGSKANDLLRKKIREIWGDTKQSKEIEDVFRRRTLDLFKLIQCCEKKGQSILTAVGYVLAMHDSNDVLVQCECGEIMGFQNDMYKELAKLYRNGKIECKRCDPRHFEKIQKASRQLGYEGKVGRIGLPTKDEDFLP